MTSMLFLSSELPYPPFSGGRLKSWKLVKFLSAHYELTVACILKGSDGDYVEDFLSRVTLADFVSEPVTVPRTAANLAISYLKRMPLNLYRTWSERFRETVRKRSGSHDVIFVDHYEVFQYVPPGYPGMVALHTHNAEYVMWARFARSSANPAKRLAALMESHRIRRHEREACRRSDLVFAAPNDIDSFTRIGVDPDRCRVTYHLGDDSQLHLPPLRFEEAENALLYLGSLDWEANVDGLLWFLETTWPALKERHPDLKFHVLGKNPDPRLTEAARELADIRFYGFVEDPEPFFRASRVFVAPLRFGSGIKVKVLNAMCRGIPTATTRVGVEGLKARHMEHLAIADTPDDMISAIDRLLTDRRVWERLESQSRQLIEAEYTWARTLGDMKRELDTALARKHAAVASSDPVPAAR